LSRPDVAPFSPNNSISPHNTAPRTPLPLPQIWFQEDFRNSWDACPWEEDLQYCRAVCERLGVSGAARCRRLAACVVLRSRGAAARGAACSQCGFKVLQLPLLCCGCPPA
jgi:hypothetical protein